MNLSNVVRKAKRLLFVRYSNTISTQHNLYGALFQDQALIRAKELLSVLASFRQTPNALFAHRRSRTHPGERVLTELWMLRQPASGVCFYRKSRELGENLRKTVKNFHNLDLEGFWRLGWSSGGKLDGEDYCFKIGASKLFNNSITSPTKYGKCPYFYFFNGLVFSHWTMVGQARSARASPKF